MNLTKKAILLLADGTYFIGESYGAQGTATGEICFNTGMTGYQEVFTDPSYSGQIIIMNAAHIGNYGAKDVDVESDTVKISGLIAKNLAKSYSRTLADGSLEDYLIKNNIVAIHQIDTRALVAHVRDAGAMNCIISNEIDADNLDIEALRAKLAEVPSMEGLDLSILVSTKEPYNMGNPDAKHKIAVMDYGVKRNILQCMVDRGAYLTIYPSKTPFETIVATNPDAYFLSNGPGDPASMDYAIETVHQILSTNKPVFGICLGHQLLSLASGAKTYKMHHGHRGLNHPVLNLKTLKSEISTQNHGFAVDKASVEALPNVEITHINLNDQTLEGIKLTDKPAFSVQYHPEATPGPHDSRYLFDDFMQLIDSQ
jgi:carbamoyl-phosphate synthase small subunit